MSKSLKASAQGSKAASGAAVKGLCAASQSVSDSSHHSSAVVQSWMSSEKNSYVIQMKKKLKSHPDYKTSGENQLLSAARKLVSEEELFCDFSHLIHDEQREVIMEATQFDNNEMLANSLEVQAGKEREQNRFDRLVKLKLTVCLCDIGKGVASLHKDRTVISIANFLSMEYSGKHASILVDDVLLEWDNGNVIFPRRVSDADLFIFEGDVRESGDYFNRIADLRPQLGEELRHFDEESEVLCQSLKMKEELIKSIVAVVVKYNSAYYYNMVSRNCQDFAKAVLEAARITGEKFSPENEEYLQLFREGKMRVPQVFKNHEDIEGFVMKIQDKNGLQTLNDHEMRWLVKAYNTHHGGKPCAEPTCQFGAVTANVTLRQSS